MRVCHLAAGPVHDLRPALGPISKPRCVACRAILKLLQSGTCWMSHCRKMWGSRGFLPKIGTMMHFHGFKLRPVARLMELNVPTRGRNVEGDLRAAAVSSAQAASFPSSPICA